MGQSKQGMKENYQIVPDFIKRMMNTETLSLSSKIVIQGCGGWQSSLIRKYIPLLNEWEVQQLYLIGNKHHSFLKQFIHISFPSLRKLNLKDNRIVSVEGMGLLFMPNLEWLCLGMSLEIFQDNNLLIDIYDLRKSRWPLLTYLSFNQNHIFEGKILMEMKSFSKIQYLKIDDLEAGQLQDVSWIAKSSFFYCEELWIVKNKRIQQKNINQAIKRKFPRIIIGQY